MSTSGGSGSSSGSGSDNSDSGSESEASEFDTESESESEEGSVVDPAQVDEAVQSIAISSRIRALKDGVIRDGVVMQMLSRVVQTPVTEPGQRPQRPKLS